MTITLKGKKAMVTGASKGIGKSIALKLAKQGADVILVSRNKEKLERVATEIKSIGRKTKIVDINVGNKQDIDYLMNEILPFFGGVDIFVNNAGITTFKNIMETTSEEVDNMISTNIKGAIFCLQGVAKQMIKQKRKGSIIVITSINALRPLHSQAFYSSTKAALESITKSFAFELSKYNIRVNSIAPGAIDTDMNKHFNDKIREKVSAQIPLGRIGYPDDIADVVCFLASNESRYMTGSTLVVDGGLLI